MKKHKAGKRLTGCHKTINQDSRPGHDLRLHVKCDGRGKSQLDLSHRGLQYIPRAVFMLQQLEVLKFGHNHLELLPPDISCLHNLQALHLQHNLLTTLPSTLTNCHHLTHLDLTANRLTMLPTALGRLTKLKVLRLADNQLEQIPHEIGCLGSLRVLDLHSNKLCYFPFSIQNLYHLLRLDLSNNLFDQIPLVVTKLTWLRALNMAANRLASLPPDFDQLRELRELNISDNRFVTLGLMATKLRQLKYLSLSYNRLQELPPQIARLKNLQVLHAKGNSLQSLPEGFPQLKYLNVANNKLQELSLLHTKELLMLDASGNLLQHLPKGIFTVKKLRRLQLARNAISEVPEDIGWLKRLEVLDLSDNQLLSLPAALHFMDKLASFNVRGNPNIARVRMPHDAASKQDQPQQALPAAVSRLTPTRATTSSRHSGQHSLPHLQHHFKPRSGQTRRASHDTEHATIQKQLDKTWLDNFLLTKHKSLPTAMWDADTTLRSTKSTVYPSQNYDLKEIQAHFSDEKMMDNKNKDAIKKDQSAMTSQFGSIVDSDSGDSAIETESYCSQVSHCQGNEAQLQQWSHHHHHPSLKSPTKKKGHKWGFFKRSNKKSGRTSDDGQEEQTERKLPLHEAYSSPTVSAPQSSSQQSIGPQNTSSKKGIQYNSFKPATEGENLGVKNLGIYTSYSYTGSEEPRQMQVLRTSSSSKASSSRDHSLTKDQTAGKDVYITNTEPLLIHSWTQTPQDEVLQAQAAVISCAGPPASSSTTWNTCSRMSIHNPCATFLQPANSSAYQPNYSSLNAADLLTPASHMPASSLGPLSSLNSAGVGANWPGKERRSRGTRPQYLDYSLLGLANQTQSLLHHDLLQPSKGGNSQPYNRNNQPKPVSEVAVGLEFSPKEIFTLTERGGNYVSAFCPHVQVSAPPGAVNKTLHVTLQQLTLGHQVLQVTGQMDKYLSNLLAVGPILFFNPAQPVTFTCPITLTLPAPKVKGQSRGHLTVVTVQPDNSCVPCTSAYQSSRCEVTLTTWHLIGKVALLTKAKCKYKACKSMEHLLSALNILTSRPHSDTTHDQQSSQ